MEDSDRNPGLLVDLEPIMPRGRQWPISGTRPQLPETGMARLRRKRRRLITLCDLRQPPSLATAFPTPEHTRLVAEPVIYIFVGLGDVRDSVGDLGGISSQRSPVDLKPHPADITRNRGHGLTFEEASRRLRTRYVGDTGPCAGTV